MTGVVHDGPEGDAMSSDGIHSPTREALDRLGGAAKKVAGAVTGDADLTEEGKAQSAAADGRREARQLADEADLQRAEAEVIEENERLEVERQRIAADAAAAARDEQIDRERRTEQ